MQPPAEGGEQGIITEKRKGNPNPGIVAWKTNRSEKEAKKEIQQSRGE